MNELEKFPRDVVRRPDDFISELQSSKEDKRVAGPRECPKWVPPPQGRYEAGYIYISEQGQHRSCDQG